MTAMSLNDRKQRRRVPESGCCPLCGGADLAHFHRDTRRDYLSCTACQLVVVPTEQHLSAEDEKYCYDQHQNDPADPRYRQFLSRLFQPLHARIHRGACGLDFGSGPGPTLALMFEEAGHPMANYDPYYAPDDSVLSTQYDFVTASEVVEHLRQPSRCLETVWDTLKPGGWLGIMTKRVLDVAAFGTWHYKNDPTHVTFFSEATFAWLAVHWQAELIIEGPDVVLLRKPHRR